MTRLFALLTLVLATLASPLCAADAWTDDFAAAKTKAASEKKDLLLDFTGSDWCPACMALRKEVFSLEEFQTEAQKHFVLVELDYPRAKIIATAIRKQNADLQSQFAIDSYPSVYLTDEKGRPYALTTYAPGGPQKYLASLEKLRAQRGARDEMLSKADKAAGLERAKLLDAALAALALNGVRVGYDDVMAEIQKLDADNAAGLKKKYEVLAKYNAVMGSLNDPDATTLMPKIEDLLKNPAGLTGENKQELWFVKANLYAGQKDMLNAVAALNQAKAAAPDSDRAKLIDQLLSNIARQQMKKQSK